MFFCEVWYFSLPELIIDINEFWISVTLIWLFSTGQYHLIFSGLLYIDDNLSIYVHLYRSTGFHFSTIDHYLETWSMCLDVLSFQLAVAVGHDCGNIAFNQTYRHVHKTYVNMDAHIWTNVNKDWLRTKSWLVRDRQGLPRCEMRFCNSPA